MRGVLVVTAIALLSACQREPAPQSPEASSKAVAGNAVTGAELQPAIGEASKIEGWETGRGAYPMLGSTLPDFKAKRLGGGEVTQGDLRDHWTIVGLWNGSGAPAKEEMRYIGALNSATDQDPD